MYPEVREAFPLSPLLLLHVMSSSPLVDRCCGRGGCCVRGSHTRCCGGGCVRAAAAVSAVGTAVVGSPAAVRTASAAVGSRRTVGEVGRRS